MEVAIWAFSSKYFSLYIIRFFDCLILSSSTFHTAFGLSWFQHLVSSPCSCRRRGGHLHPLCGLTGVSCRCLHPRMTGRIGLRHQDSRGKDTLHISEFRWVARQLPVKECKKAIDKFISLLTNRLYVSYLRLKIGRILYQYSSSLKNSFNTVFQLFNHC